MQCFPMEDNIGQLEGRWFSEVSEDFHSHAFSLKIKKLLYHEKSEIQDILVFEK